ncbi:hypothetical protein AU476_33035 [Cupriavidus sp. UYMSc13B]|nr:hypothetical protein AU476_33035 [Cupriavidus sp. UYMSc13B]
MASMFANSRTIVSAQADVHEHLAERVARHLAEPFRKPIGEAAGASSARRCKAGHPDEVGS